MKPEEMADLHRAMGTGARAKAEVAHISRLHADLLNANQLLRQARAEADQAGQDMESARGLLDHARVDGLSRSPAHVPLRETGMLIVRALTRLAAESYLQLSALSILLSGEMDEDAIKVPVGGDLPAGVEPYTPEEGRETRNAL